MSGQVSRGSAGQYQADERAGVAGLRLGHEQGALMNRIHALMKETPEIPLTPYCLLRAQ